MTAIATVTTAAFAWKASTHATDKTTEAQEKASAVTGFDLLTQRMETRLGRVESKLGMAEARITALEADNRKKETLIGHLLDYARRLRSVLREHNIEIPEPPHDVRDKF